MKKLKFQFNLSIKIVLSVILLLTVTTTTNIFYSYFTFTKDKMSYLHDILLRKTESSHKLIDNYFDRIKENSKINYIVLVNESSHSKEIFSTNNDLILFKKYIYSENEFKLTDKFQNEEGFKKIKLNYGFTEDFLENEIKSYLNKEIIKKKNVVNFVKFKNQNIGLLTIYKDAYRDDVLISLYSIDEFNKVLASEKTFKKEFFTLEDNSLGHNLNAHWFKDIDYKKFKYGSNEIDIQGQVSLLAYSTSESNNFIITTYLNKKDALTISNFLVMKTILFSFILLGVAIALGIYFASAISSPLKELANKADSIKQGKFNQKIYFKSQDELGLLASAFNNMSSEIQELINAKESIIKKLEVANKKLDVYSHKLEALVDERTKELKKANHSVQLMINSLDEGLFVFDRDLKCTDVATKACEQIFNSQVAGNSLFTFFQITPDKIDSIQEWATVVFEELIPFESAIELGPKHLVLNGKQISVNYFPIRDEGQKIVNVVGVAKDISEEVMAKDLKEKQEKYVKMILKISRNKNQFLSFCNEVEVIFLKINEELHDHGADRTHLCLMHFHTLNGGFGMYYLYDFQHWARKIESMIADFNKADGDLEAFKNVIKEESEQLKLEFRKFVKKLDDELKTQFSSGIKKIEIEKMELEKFSEKLKSQNNQNIALEFKNKFINEPIGQYFFTFKELCQNLAQNLGKKINEVEIKNGDLRINIDEIIDLINLLPHLFRNAIDHGIENPRERLSLNKPELGTIKIDFKTVDENLKQFLIINIQDDGKGIDPLLIKEKYKRLFPQKDVSHLTDRELQYLIFDPLFTTKDEVTSTSGRGVGISTVAELLNERGGNINLISKVGIGTKFELKIPLKS